MKKDKLTSLIRECVEESLQDYFLFETLVLKRAQSRKYGPILAVVSDEQDQKKARQETFRNKNELRQRGFSWDADLNSWVISQEYLRKAQESVSAINRTPLEKFIEKVEEIPEFIKNADNMSKKDEMIRRIDQFVDQLSSDVDNAAKSAMIQQFLAFNAKFHNYSFYNTLLIWLQKRDATKVAGFKQWQEKFHRTVKKGAQAITILAPIKPKRQDQEPETDDEEPQDRGFIRFIAVSVFDISDTEPMDASGEVPETPSWHANNEPNEIADKLFNYAKELAEDMGIQISNDGSRRGEQGFSAGDHINLSSEVSGVNKTATLIHEIAHELLHHKKSSPFYVGEEGTVLTREQAELQAESVSYIVLNYFDLPVHHQANYLALWKANKDSVRNNLSVIKKASDFIITELNKIQKSHEQAQTNQPPQQTQPAPA